MADENEPPGADPDASSTNDQAAGSDPAKGPGEVDPTKPPSQTPPSQPPPDNPPLPGGGGPQSFSQWLRTPPGEMLVGSGAIVLTSVFLILLTVSLLAGMTVMWPPCNFPPETQPTPTPTPGAANVNSNNSNANGHAANSNGNAANANNTNSGNINSNNTNANNAARSGATPAAPPPAASPTPIADIDTIDPASGSVLGNTPVTIKGKNLLPAESLTVKFGEDAVTPTKVTENSISVRTPKHSEGVVDVSVLRKGKDDKPVEEDRLPAAYTYVCAAPEGSTLFWMLIMAGALGGCIHALRSLWWYTGQGTLKWKWMLMYFCLPFTGAAMAMLFSLLIVAGFVSDTTGRGGSLFIIAVAGLVGMFTQQAALKLNDIANAFFTKPGEGKDSNPQPSLPVSGTGTGTGGTEAKINPPSGPIAGNKSVTITDTGFADVKNVLFDGKPSTTKPVISDDKSFITATPPPHVSGTVAVIVTNNAGDVKTGQYKYE